MANQSCKRDRSSTNRLAGNRARDICGIIEDDFPESVYTLRGFCGARAWINKDDLDSYISTAALIKLFNEKETP